MRVLAVRPGPHFSVQDVYAGWVRALRTLGATVIDVNLDDRLSFYENARVRRDGEWQVAFPDPADVVRLAAKGVGAACYEAWPDVVIVVSAFYLPAEYLDVMVDRGHKVVLIHTESPYEDSRQIELAARVTVNVVNDPTNLERFRRVNPATIYLPHAYDPEIHTPDGPGAQPSDFCFVGTGFTSRREFFEAVDFTGLDVVLAGNWRDPGPLGRFLAHAENECVDNLEAVRLYRSTKASANLYRREAMDADTAEGWAMGPREVELAATGCFFLTEARGENRAVLPMVPTFTDPQDFTEALRWWLAHDDARTDVVRQARAAVADRTFVNNAKRLFELLETG